MARTAEALIDVMRSWAGYSESNGKFKQIIDLYNSHKPLARGYVVKYTDEWCDTTVSAAAIKAGMVDLIGTECGCEEHIKIFKSKGIWIEDGTITPKPGYIILYNWGDSTQPNDGHADHIGVVESVSSGQISVIEGNMHSSVGRRKVAVGWGYIRGYAAPHYDESASTETPVQTTAPTQASQSVPAQKPTPVKAHRFSLAVDGILGPASIRALQMWLGTPVDGEVSGQAVSCKKYLSACPSPYWQYLSHATGSMMIKALQRHVGSSADGIAGKGTVKALQNYLRGHGYNISVDGYLGPNTAKALQRYLNSL